LSTPVRVRFAPSPTGHLHIGGARTAVYNWALARHTGGTFILRIDDTDPERSTEANVAAILRGLRWLGLDWDEGPEIGGTHGPYFQTLRAFTYVEALEVLRAGGHAYPCFCSAEQLETNRDAARSRGGFAGYDRTCRRLDAVSAAARVEAGEPHVWRLAVPKDRTEVAFDDAIRGHMSFPADALDDFVLLRSDGTPTYNYASVVDDALMEITHVVRGDDHLSNTPRQILLFEALGHEVPVFAHLPMIWGPDGKRLSKRHGAVSVEAYRDSGYLPEAVLNYLALLGWSLDGETTIISAQTLCDSFSLERVSSNPAILDTGKLDWMNGAYIRALPADEFVDRMAPWLVEAGLVTVEDLGNRREWLLKLVPLISERVKRFDEIVPMVRFLFEEAVEIDPTARAKALVAEGAPQALASARVALADLPAFGSAAIEEALRAVPEATGSKPKVVFQAVRVAVTGTTVSPPLFESLELLGRERTLARLEAATAGGVDGPLTHP
jgi:glutamyl-tRNA synthetase